MQSGKITLKSDRFAIAHIGYVMLGSVSHTGLATFLQRRIRWNSHITVVKDSSLLA